MSLWVDKHRPRCLDQLRVHSKPARQLQKLLAGGDCPHLLFYGPSGAGKKTLCLATLRELFGPSVEKLRTEQKTWQIQLPSRKIEVELATVSSNYHLEVSPADAGRRDVHVVQEIIKEMAKTRSSTSVFQQQQQQQEQEQETSLVKPAMCAYKVLVINQVDKLSSHAQHALRRTLEKYSATCRVIFTCTNLSKVMGPVRSRCVCVRVKAPSTEEISELVSEVAGKERKEVPRGLANKIAASSERSMRRALLMLETASLGKLDESQELQLPDWELFIKDVAQEILREQTPKNLYLVRGKLYELLVNCVPADTIFCKLVHELLRKVDDTIKYDIVSTAATFEHRMRLGTKPIFHLEAFVAKTMSIYKEWSISNFG